LNGTDAFAQYPCITFIPQTLRKSGSTVVAWLRHPDRAGVKEKRAAYAGAALRRARAGAPATAASARIDRRIWTTGARRFARRRRAEERAEARADPTARSIGT